MGTRKKAQHLHIRRTHIRTYPVENRHKSFSHKIINISTFNVLLRHRIFQLCTIQFKRKHSACNFKRKKNPKRKEERSGLNEATSDQ